MTNEKYAYLNADLRMHFASQKIEISHNWDIDSLSNSLTDVIE